MYLHYLITWLQLIFLYAISSFKYSHLLWKIVLSTSLSIHISNKRTTSTSQLNRGHLSFSMPLLLPPRFHNPRLNHVNPTISFELHWFIHISLHHSCFIFHRVLISFLSLLLCFICVTRHLGFLPHLQISSFLPASHNSRSTIHLVPLTKSYSSILL